VICDFAIEMLDVQANSVQISNVDNNLTHVLQLLGILWLCGVAVRYWTVPQSLARSSPGKRTAL